MSTDATQEAIEREVREFALRCPVPLPPGDAVLLGHGSGGQLTQALIRDLFVPTLGGDPELSRMGDAAVVPLPGGGRLAFTTDGFVVQPAFFPGANIGELAVNGTVNDLAMMGAEPLALSAALILEEGLPMERLAGVMTSMAEACDRGGLASVLNELAAASEVSMTIVERDVPVLPAVKAACEMLGLDPLYVANEGVAVAVVAPADTDAVLAAARGHEFGVQAAVVGEVGEPPVAVRSRSGLGTTRPLIMLAGDQLPRIC